MPLTPAFTISQSALTPSNVTATDTSTGSDAAIVSRRIYFQTSEGSYLVEDGTITSYEEWSYANVSETFNILDVDAALAITVEWLDVSNTVLYTLTQVYSLREYNKNFLVYLGQLQALTPGILQDSNYAMNMAIYWAYVQYAYDMVEQAADIASSQNLLDKATFMRQNESKFF